jgi:hypothetical protein
MNIHSSKLLSVEYINTYLHYSNLMIKVSYIKNNHFRASNIIAKLEGFNAFVAENYEPTYFKGS